MMTVSRSIMSREEIGRALARRMDVEPGFRERLLTDPNGTYEAATGQVLPPGGRIVILQDDDLTVHFVLPMRPEDIGELSDAELEAVAGDGGASWTSISVAVSQLGFQLSQSIGGVAQRRQW